MPPQPTVTRGRSGLEDPKLPQTILSKLVTPHSVAGIAAQLAFCFSDANLRHYVYRA